MNEEVVDGRIIPLARVDARVEPFDWAFAREREADIATHWARAIAGKPAMFNGRIMLQHRARVAEGVFHAGYFEADYAAFLSWRDFGLPGQPIRNGFAMGALRTADGAFLCGRMGPQTANAGKVYFAAGTPDPSDVRPDGTLDLAGSVIRELGEETGLMPEELTVEERWDAVVLPGRIAFMRPVLLDLPAEEARAMMLARMAGLEEQELDDIVILREPADCDRHDMALFMRPYLAHIYGRD